MTLEKITISANQRFLITQSGKPFFWLGDTAWELFHRLNRAEAVHYLETRRQQGFNVIQAVILAELDGLHTSNPNGRLPLCGDDPSRPNELYFQDVDEIIRIAAQKDLYIGLLPTWGDKVHGGLWGTGPVIFNTENAFSSILGKGAVRITSATGYCLLKNRSQTMLSGFLLCCVLTLERN